MRQDKDMDIYDILKNECALNDGVLIYILTRMYGINISTISIFSTSNLGFNSLLNQRVMGYLYVNAPKNSMYGINSSAISTARKTAAAASLREDGR